MAARRVSGPALARTLGVSQAALYARLNGVTRLSVEEFAAIAETFEMTPNRLLELADDFAADKRYYAPLSPVRWKGTHQLRLWEDSDDQARSLAAV